MPAILVRTQRVGRFDDLIDDERAALVTALRQTTDCDGLVQWPPVGENRFRPFRQPNPKWALCPRRGS